MTACSWRAGWRSLLIRAYEDPAEAEEFVTPATRDHLIVLVTGGSCDVEVRYRSGWQHSHSEPGHIGMTAPGQAATLRWRGTRHTAPCNSIFRPRPSNASHENSGVRSRGPDLAERPRKQRSLGEPADAESERCVSRIRARSLCSDCGRDVGRPSLGQARPLRRATLPQCERRPAAQGRRLHARESRVRSESGGSGARGRSQSVPPAEIVQEAVWADSPAASDLPSHGRGEEPLEGPERSDSDNCRQMWI